MTRSLQETRHRYEALLLGRRRTLLGDLDGLDLERGEEGREGAGVPQHLADIGSDSFEYDVNRSCTESAATEIQEIDDALVRIREGSFGLCEECGREIPASRLDAIPWTRLCILCKAQEEAA